MTGVTRQARIELDAGAGQCRIIVDRQALVDGTLAEADGAEAEELAVCVYPLFVELIVARKRTDNRSVGSAGAADIGALSGKRKAGSKSAIIAAASVSGRGARG